MYSYGRLESVLIGDVGDGDGETLGGGVGVASLDLFSNFRGVSTD